MRWLVRRIGLRYTVGFGLLLALAIILVVLRALPHSAPAGVVNAAGAGAPSVSPGPPDDGGVSIGPPPSPWTSPGAASPLQIAAEFTGAWLHHTGVSATDWYAALARYCTPALASQFTGVDPAGVPADRIVGSPIVVDYASAYVQVRVPVNGGIVVLGLRATAGVWLVDSVDWNPS